MDQFRKEATNSFSYPEINKPHQPIEVGPIDLDPFKQFGMGYVNYFIPNLTTDRFTLLPLEIKNFTYQCIKFLEDHKIPYTDRRFHITLDNSPLLTGEAHREPRWHIDSGHGDKPALVFLASDILPTEFLINPPQLNWPKGEFASVAEDVQLRQALQDLTLNSIPTTSKPNTLYLMNSYQIHRGVINSSPLNKRTFLRLILDTPTRKSYPRFSQKEYSVAEKAST